jgi:hypothetical protein
MNITMEMRIFFIKIMNLVVNYYNNIYHEFVEAQDSKASVAEGRAGGIVDNTLLIKRFVLMTLYQTKIRKHSIFKIFLQI